MLSFLPGRGWGRGGGWTPVIFHRHLKNGGNFQTQVARGQVTRLPEVATPHKTFERWS